MPRRSTSIAAALSVLALGSPLMTGCANPLATNFYNSGVEKYVKGDYQVLFTDYSNAILVISQYDGAYANRGLVKDKLFDVNGFCAYVKKSIISWKSPISTMVKQRTLCLVSQFAMRHECVLYSISTCLVLFEDER